VKYVIYIRTSVISTRVSKFSVKVKIVPFRTFYVCFNNCVALWLRCSSFKFKRCYNKCMNMFLDMASISSVTLMLLDLRLPSFDTVTDNYLDTPLENSG